MFQWVFISCENHVIKEMSRTSLVDRVFKCPLTSLRAEAKSFFGFSPRLVIWRCLFGVCGLFLFVSVAIEVTAGREEEAV